MKRLLIILLALTAITGLRAATYSVKDIPNVHLADSTRFVSNPDGVFSPAGEQAMNNRLRRLMRNTTAEVAVVAVGSLDRDIDDFATDLFRTWGLGKKDTDNGLLLLISTDSREVVFRTGQGLEGLLPDGVLGSIIRREITPRFREGDYDGGADAALQAVETIISSPEGREEILSKYANNGGASSAHDFDLFGAYMRLAAFLTAGLLVWFIFVLVRSGGKSRYDRYLAVNKVYPTALFMTFVCLGLPLVVLIPLLIVRHRLRRGPHPCPRCSTHMDLIDEQHDNDFLTQAQDLEEQIGSIDYDVWVCPKCSETEIIPYVQRSSAYKECPVCHARAMKVVSDHITSQPTVDREGIRTITYRCLNCGFEDYDNRRIPRKTPPPPVIILPGSGGSGGGGGFGGGSFGGGFTAGGGARGGW